MYAARGQTTLTRASCPSGSESLLVRVDDDAVLRIHADLASRAISPRQVWLVGNTARLRGRLGVQQICGTTRRIEWPAATE